LQKQLFKELFIALQKPLCCHANKLVVFGIWYTPTLRPTPRLAARNDMSRTTSFGLAPSSSLFSRLLSVIDRVLMINAEIAHRNGDVTYFGL
jgi:hypothetical protein